MNPAGTTPAAAPRAVGFADAIFLGRCRKCKKRHRIHAPVLEVKIRHLGYGRTERVYWRTVNGSRVEGYDRIFTACQACGVRPDGGHVSIEMKLLRGRFSEKHQCAAKCMNAHGHVCECSCGGANHGRSFA